MRDHSPSRTAEYNALFRAVECARTPQERMLHDPLAREFLGASFRFVALLSRIPMTSGVLRRYIDYRWPGSRTSVIARTRWIDDRLTAALANEVSQVVLLGAGFDSRAYRIPGATRACFFEVDHPNTSATKMTHLRRIFSTLPGHVKYVPLDFQRDSLKDSLESAGFNPQSRSVVIWEGVSNYLTEQAVRKTLAFVAGLGAGTMLIFTYVDRTVLEKPRQFAGGSEVQRLIARLEEPWKFGIYPGEAPGFFRQCGLYLDSDLSAVEYRNQYYGTAKPIVGYEFYHIVMAHVPSDRPPKIRAEYGGLHRA